MPAAEGGQSEQARAGVAEARAAKAAGRASAAEARATADAEVEEDYWSRSFSFTSPSRPDFAVTVKEAFHAGLGGTVWGGSVALARYLAAGAADSAAAELQRGGKRELSAVELGCGASGLPSLVLVHLRLIHHVCLTDCDEDCLEVLRENVAAAQQADNATSVSVASLDWAALGEAQPVDLVLCADVVYKMEDAEAERCTAAAAALVGAIDRLAAEGAVVLLSHFVKPLHEERAFIAALSGRFRCERVSGGGAGEEGGREDGMGIFRLHRECKLT